MRERTCRGKPTPSRCDSAWVGRALSTVRLSQRAIAAEPDYLQHTTGSRDMNRRMHCASTRSSCRSEVTEDWRLETRRRYREGCALLRASPHHGWRTPHLCRMRCAGPAYPRDSFRGVNNGATRSQPMAVGRPGTTGGLTAVDALRDRV